MALFPAEYDQLRFYLPHGGVVDKFRFSSPVAAAINDPADIPAVSFRACCGDRSGSQPGRW
jgi:hypothetical protein